MSDLYDDNTPGEQERPETEGWTERPAGPETERRTERPAGPEAERWTERPSGSSENPSFESKVTRDPSFTGSASRSGEESEHITYSWVSPKLRDAQEQKEETPSSNQWRYAGNLEQEPVRRDIPGGGYAGKEERKEPVRKPRRVNSAPHDKKKKSAGKKWLTTIALAVVFGLVAGLVFTGVTMAGRKMTAEPEPQRREIASTEQAEAADTFKDEAVEVPSYTAGGTVADVAAQCMPSLVTISTISVEEMRSFFGQTQQYEVEGAGTGVIVGQNETEILIATNNHVVEGAKSLSVGFIDETAVAGAVKGYDSSTDLAVVAVKLDDIAEDTMNQIKICEMGNSDELVLGEQVVAIGNALGYGQSVTSGYISAFNRELNLTDNSGRAFSSTGLIQTDASINSGNSGGALLNMRGQLIGINEAKRSGNSTGASVDNIGFAIPISKAEPILENLMTLVTRDKVNEDQAAYIGITCANVSQETAQMYNMPTGVCLTSIFEGSPAEQAGLKKGDILTSFDGREVNSYEELINILQYYPAGETVEVIVQRSDEGEYSERTVTLTLGSAADMPSNEN